MRFSLAEICAMKQDYPAIGHRAIKRKSTVGLLILSVCDSLGESANDVSSRPIHCVHRTFL